MSSCESQLLSAYLDGELSPQQAQQVESHLRQCPQCRAELEQLRETSTSIGGYAFENLKPQELARIHAAIDAGAEQPVWRLGVILSGLAASILVISATWLAELPPRPTQPRISVSASTADNWEAVAMTLRAPPLPMEPPEPGEIRVADAQLAQWMLDGLSGNAIQE